MASWLKRQAALVSVLLLGVSLAGCYPDLDWRPLTPTGGRFTVLMPAKSQEESRPIPGGVTMHMWTTSAADTVFGAGYADYSDDARGHFDAVRDAFLGKTGNKIVEDREIMLHEMRSRALAIDASTDGQPANARTMQVRLFSHGHRLYQLAIISRKGGISAEDVELYFDSFRIKE